MISFNNSKVDLNALKRNDCRRFLDFTVGGRDPGYTYDWITLDGSSLRAAKEDQNTILTLEKTIFAAQQGA
ncbi:MAG: hypothetical protein QNK85_07340 [Crocinitomicaceae bacterium]